MQTMEAVLSLMVLVSVSSLLLQPGEPPLDSSLYRMQLAEDSWRVLYLKGSFRDFGASAHAKLEEDLELLGEQTHLCFFIDGVFITNCRGGTGSHEIISSVRKTVVYGGSLRNMTFSIGN